MIRSERKIFCMQVGHFKLSLSLLSFVHFKRNGQLACENERFCSEINMAEIVNLLFKLSLPPSLRVFSSLNLP